MGAGFEEAMPPALTSTDEYQRDCCNCQQSRVAVAADHGYGIERIPVLLRMKKERIDQTHRRSKDHEEHSHESKGRRQETESEAPATNRPE